jgi:hypothetical protein
MNRRTFTTTLTMGVAASTFAKTVLAADISILKARNVVLVHGLYADGSC